MQRPHRVVVEVERNHDLPQQTHVAGDAVLADGRVALGCDEARCEDRHAVVRAALAASRGTAHAALLALLEGLE